RTTAHRSSSYKTSPSILRQKRQESFMKRHLILIFIIALAAPLHAADIQLEQGLGNIHYAVSTQNAAAQKWFDQGMRYVYAFNHEQAIASFKKATELDPNLALGYWGAALALGPNINMDVDPEREKQAFESVKAA